MQGADLALKHSLLSSCHSGQHRLLLPLGRGLSPGGALPQGLQLGAQRGRLGLEVADVAGLMLPPGLRLGVVHKVQHAGVDRVVLSPPNPCLQSQVQSINRCCCNNICSASSWLK